MKYSVMLSFLLLLLAILPVSNSAFAADCDVTPAFTYTGETEGTYFYRITFDASGSSDPNGTILFYFWDFDNDGMYDTVTSMPKATWVYDLREYSISTEVTLTVLDDQMCEATVTDDVMIPLIRIIPPVADLTVTSPTLYYPYCYSFDASASHQYSYDIIEYRFDFDGDGCFDHVGDGPLASHTYDLPGIYHARLEVLGKWDRTDQTSVTITVPSSWPMTGGNPQNSGACAVNGPTEGNAVWNTIITTHKLTIPPIVGADGTVYIAEGSGILHAVGSDGLELWARSIGTSFKHSPVIGLDGILYGITNGGLTAVSLTGAPQTVVFAEPSVLSAPVLSPSGMICYASSLGTLVCAGQPNLPQICAALPQPDLMTPLVRPDGIYLVPAQDGTLYGVDQTGKLVLKIGFNTNITGVCVDSQNAAFVALDDGRIMRIDADGTKTKINSLNSAPKTAPAISPTGMLIVGTADGLLHAMDTDGNKIWLFDWPFPAIDHVAIDIDENIYFCTTDGLVQALDSEGTKLWAYAMPHAAGSSPVLVENRVYVGCENGMLFAIE